MTRNLDKYDQAYNAVIDALNEADEELDEALANRNSLLLAAEELHGLGEHGASARPLLELTAVKK